jgi:hypothetical protein
MPGALQFKLMLSAAKTILWRELLLLLPRRRCALRDLIGWLYCWFYTVIRGANASLMQLNKASRWRITVLMES